MRIPKPAPLPPRPEGLKLPLWPALAAAVVLVVAFRHWAVALLGAGLVVGYAVWARRDPRNQLLYTYIQGRMQFSAGKYEAALANFTDMEEADFAPPAVLRAIGLTHYHLGHWAEAATYLEDVPRRTPDEDAALAHALAELGETGVASAVLEAMDRLTSLAAVVRAVLEFRAGEAETAAADLERVLASAGGGDAPLEEPFLGARYWLGMARRAAGDREGARQAFEQVYGIDPGYHDVAELLGRAVAPPKD